MKHFSFICSLSASAGRLRLVQKCSNDTPVIYYPAEPRCFAAVGHLHKHGLRRKAQYSGQEAANHGSEQV